MAEVCGRPRPLGVVGIVGDLVLAVRAVSEGIEVLFHSIRVCWTSTFSAQPGPSRWFEALLF